MNNESKKKEIENLVINLKNPNNKAAIYNYYSHKADLTVLESTLKRLEENKDNIKELEELKELINNRLSKLQQQDNLKSVIEESKKENSILNDFKLIYSPKELNDNLFGFKKDANYLKISFEGIEKIYEIDEDYIENIKNILGNKELIKDLSKKELFDKIKPYIKELNDINMNINTNLDESEIIKEIKNIPDNSVRNIFLKDIKNVLKERYKLNEYIKNNDLEQEKISYNINSRGERVYMIGEQVIKFSDEDRKMHFLTESNQKRVDEKNSDDTKENLNVLESSETRQSNYKFIPNNLDDMDNEKYISLINETLYTRYNGNNIYSESNNELIEQFFKLCIEYEKNKDNIPPRLNEIYNQYSDYFMNYNDFYNDNVKSIFKDKIKKKLNEQELKEQNGKPKVLVPTLNDKNIGFVNIIYIICSIIMITLITLYILLVK